MLQGDALLVSLDALGATFLLDRQGPGISSIHDAGKRSLASGCLGSERRDYLAASAPCHLASKMACNLGLA